MIQELEQAYQEKCGIQLPDLSLATSLDKKESDFRYNNNMDYKTKKLFSRYKLNQVIEFYIRTRIRSNDYGLYIQKWISDNFGYNSSKSNKYDYIIDNNKLECKFSIINDQKCNCVQVKCFSKEYEDIHYNIFNANIINNGIAIVTYEFRLTPGQMKKECEIFKAGRDHGGVKWTGKYYYNGGKIYESVRFTYKLFNKNGTKTIDGKRWFDNYLVKTYEN